MELKIGKKTYTIKYGYEVTAKSRILSKMSELDNDDDNEGFKTVENMMALLPELLLVGLQKNHKKDFSYNYSTEDGKEEALSKVYEMMDDYCEQEDSDCMELYNELSDELFKNGFLKSLFLRIQQSAEEQTEQTEQ